MAQRDSQAFLRELDQALWTAADSRRAAETVGGNLRSNLDAAVYKHAVLGLIFLNYGSDSDEMCFEVRSRASARGFVQSESFIEEQGGTIGDIMVFGQECNPNTWRLAAMNMVIRGIDFDFGKEPADTFTCDQHSDLRANFMMANPLFNIKECWDGKRGGSARWSRSGGESASRARFYKNQGKYNRPPQGNAGFPWVHQVSFNQPVKGRAGFSLIK